MKTLGLLGGPIGAAVCFTLLPPEYANLACEPSSFSIAGRMTLSLVVWMAVWWLTEAIDLPVTALLPVVVLPLSGAMEMKAAAAPYASEIVFLIMASFVFALSMQRWGLDRRIAMLTLRIVGDRPVNMVGGVMLATAMMGGFVSNTAKVAMLLPIGVSLIGFVRNQEKDSGNFAVCVMLGIAYAASISGVSTIIGTPPNAFLAAFVRDEIAHPYQRELGFADWLTIGLPLTAIFLPFAWLLLTRILYPVGTASIKGGRDFIKQSYRELGPVNRGEWVTVFVFAATVLAWMLRQPLASIEFGSDQHVWRPFGGLSDSLIAMAGALVLFVVPTGRQAHEFVMDWRTAVRLPWDVLALFGGGLSLAGAVERNGVAEFIAAQAVWLHGLPPAVVLIAVVIAVILFSEVASNTATATTMIPILATMAPALGVHPYFLIFPATFAASFAFMLPAGTPPNAVVFGTGFVSMRQMCWAGLWMNVMGAGLIIVATYVIIKPALGMK